MKKIGVVGAGLVASCFEGLDEFEVVRHNEWVGVGCMRTSTHPR